MSSIDVQRKLSHSEAHQSSSFTQPAKIMAGEKYAKLFSLLCQLLMLISSFQIASHSYPHHASDLLMKSFCLMVMVLTIMWFRTTIQDVSRR